MQLKITTQVNADWKRVRQGFNEDLFKALNPPFPKVSLRQFDGCKKGDIVDLELNFFVFKQRWKSEIIVDQTTENSFCFIDVGVKTPFFLKSWKHQHIIQESSSGSKIIDQITYTTGTLLTDLIMYPLLVGQFLYRKPIYKKRFRA